MNNTLFDGDVIFVNKLEYGPILPTSLSEIPILNLLYYFSNDKSNKKVGRENWGFKRLSGIKPIMNGDVIVFYLNNNNENETFVKRCMAISGDTFSILNGETYINNKLFNPSSRHVINNYFFQISSNLNEFNKSLDSLEINIEYSSLKKNYLSAKLSIDDKNKLESLKFVKNIHVNVDSSRIKSTAYPRSIYNKWSWNEYGPYIIPKKNMKIKLNNKNYALYKDIIETHESNEIVKKDIYYFINGEKTTHYIFKNNYYFVMGDNRNGSKDSRFWGLVPENQIIGKVQFVVFSNYQHEFQWDRLFKKIF